MATVSPCPKRKRLLPSSISEMASNTFALSSTVKKGPIEKSWLPSKYIIFVSRFLKRLNASSTGLYSARATVFDPVQKSKRSPITARVSALRESRNFTRAAWFGSPMPLRWPSAMKTILILFLPQNFQRRLLHDAHRGLFAGPELEADGALAHQHAQSGVDLKTPFFRVLYEACLKRPGDYVRNNGLEGSASIGRASSPLPILAVGR